MSVEPWESPRCQPSAIVTGCSRGIGRAVTEMLLAGGWRVIGVSRTPALLGTPQTATRFEWRYADVGNAGDVALALGTLNLRADTLIHCAAVRGPYGPLLENDPAAWLAAIRTNLLGTYLVTRAALPLLLRSEDARILLFSGGGAFDPSPGYSAYATAKGGVVSLMETLAAELAGTSVTVNCVAPGFVATDIHAGTPEEGRDDHGAMARAVACIRHLLSPGTRGLTGKTVSARWDAWESLNPSTAAAINATGAGTRRRSLIDDVAIARAMRGAA